MTAPSRLYGLTVRSQIPLRHDHAVAHAAAVDLDIMVGAPALATAAAPNGRVLLDLQAKQQYYTGTATDDGYHLRFYGSCDVDLDADLTRAVVHAVEGVDPDVVSVIASGTLLAFVLALRGEAVLHASAVQVGDAALGFSGASGMGKSTMATLMCADGAGLITDDLLRLDLGQEVPGCALGVPESRLRKAADELAAQFAVAPLRRSTGDARAALAIPAAADEGLPLAALVVPVPHRTAGCGGARLERLATKDAFLLLSRFPRLLGWKDPDVLGRQFDQLGEVVSRVQVHLAWLPWGPPFRRDLAATVLRGVGLGTPAGADRSA